MKLQLPVENPTEFFKICNVHKNNVLGNPYRQFFKDVSGFQESQNHILKFARLPKNNETDSEKEEREFFREIFLPFWVSNFVSDYQASIYDAVFQNSGHDSQQAVIHCEAWAARMVEEFFGKIG